MTDEDFARLAAALQRLPTKALYRVEILIDMYQHPPRSPRKKPAAIRAALKTIAARADEILGALAEPDIATALADSFPGRRAPDDVSQRHIPMYPFPGAEALKEHRASLTRLRDWAKEAAQLMPRAKPGSDAGKVRWFVAALNTILLNHTGQGLTRAKRMVALARDVARIAEPAITERQITEAIDALNRARN
jgi:hypothetical protein